ncbi:hypothetical protein O6H91_05G101400 [Diphasiastrum complanatum]|uniref:Uncharacterized protein n=1 Tax=Diphasiastrum complanatum TaxID=34168 RepID=A0ACC2DRU9_DIPCM|nr:hypothetical protein O6H91_Y455400 [Diphasiastrum complanatum]KAJ7556850.1 hypothetical protein O6H91_05G101400 [Diphasiastrum complanatum]
MGNEKNFSLSLFSLNRNKTIEDYFSSENPSCKILVTTDERQGRYEAATLSGQKISKYEAATLSGQKISKYLIFGQNLRCLKHCLGVDASQAVIQFPKSLPKDD